MYHSIWFGTTNSYEDLGLVPSSRPLVNPPELKERIIDIPGADGEINLTRAINGYNSYKNRTGSWEFIVLNPWDYQFPKRLGNSPWNARYNEILSLLHGKYMPIFFEDDMDYMYIGYTKVASWTTNNDWSTVTIDYSLEPYKWLTAVKNPKTITHTQLIEPTKLKKTFWIQNRQYSPGEFIFNTEETPLQDFGDAPVVPKFRFSGQGVTNAAFGFLGRTTNFKWRYEIYMPATNSPVYSRDIVVSREDPVMLRLENTNNGNPIVLDYWGEKGYL